MLKVHCELKKKNKKKREKLRSVMKKETWHPLRTLKQDSWRLFELYDDDVFAHPKTEENSFSIVAKVCGGHSLKTPLVFVTI